MEWEGLEWEVVSELAGATGGVPEGLTPDARMRAERVSGVRRKQRERRVRGIAMQGVGKGRVGARGRCRAVASATQAAVGAAGWANAERVDEVMRQRGKRGREEERVGADRVDSGSREPKRMRAPIGRDESIHCTHRG